MRLRLLVLSLLASACSNSEKKAAPPAESPKPAEPAPTVDAAAADPAVGEPAQYKMEKPARVETTGFARFDDAVAGKAPWLTDAELAAGVVEHVDIASKVSQRRLCKQQAKEALDKYGAILVKRIKDTAYKSPSCVVSNAEETETSCIAGRGPDDEPSVLLDYRKAGEGWTLVAIQYVDGESNIQPHLKAYQKLVQTPCK